MRRCQPLYPTGSPLHCESFLGLTVVFWHQQWMTFPMRLSLMCTTTFSRLCQNVQEVGRLFLSFNVTHLWTVSLFSPNGLPEFPFGKLIFWNLLIPNPTVGQLQNTISSLGMCVLCSAFFSHPFSATRKSIWQTYLCSDLSLSSSLGAICSIFAGLWWLTRGLLCFPHEPHFSQLDRFGVAFLAFLPYVLQALAGLN